jgi:DNA repair exonuclease SbcCD nuclease subunit
MKNNPVTVEITQTPEILTGKMPFSFIHAGDLHFDSFFEGIPEDIDKRIGKQIQDAPYRAFNNIIQLCLEKKVDFLLISGDIYDSENRSILAQIRFYEGIRKLSEAGISVYIVYGNHDPTGSWTASLKPPSNCYIFPGNIITHTIIKNGLPVADITGYSHNRMHVTENIASSFPDAQGDLFHVGILHCSVDSPKEHENYAPCTKRDLLQKNFHYWALGHIHSQNTLNEAYPSIIYPGIPQGRNFRETGKRGCYYVTVDDKKRIQIEFIETDVFQFQEGDVSINGLSSLDELIAQLIVDISNKQNEAGGRPLILRYTITGRGYLHKDLSRSSASVHLKQIIVDRFSDLGHFVILNDLNIMTGLEQDREMVIQKQPFLGELLYVAAHINEDDQLKARILARIAELYGSPKISTVLQEDSLPLIQTIVSSAEHLLIDKILQEVEE